MRYPANAPSPTKDYVGSLDDSEAGFHTYPCTTENNEVTAIPLGRSETGEVHHIERRLALDAFASEYS